MIWCINNKTWFKVTLILRKVWTQLYDTDPHIVTWLVAHDIVIFGTPYMVSDQLEWLSFYETVSCASLILQVSSCSERSSTLLHRRYDLCHSDNESENSGHLMHTLHSRTFQTVLFFSDYTFNFSDFFLNNIFLSHRENKSSKSFPVSTLRIKILQHIMKSSDWKVRVNYKIKLLHS